MFGAVLQHFSTYVAVSTNGLLNIDNLNMIKFATYDLNDCNNEFESLRCQSLAVLTEDYPNI